MRPPEGYTYDPVLSDDRTAGFTNRDGEQWYAKRSELDSIPGPGDEFCAIDAHVFEYDESEQQMVCSVDGAVRCAHCDAVTVWLESIADWQHQDPTTPDCFLVQRRKI